EPKHELADGSWKRCTPQTVGSFSAAGYFFGRDIHNNENIPIGLIQNAWGGMPAESFTSKETLSSDPDFAPILERKKQPTTQDVARAKKEFDRQNKAWEAKYLRKDPGKSVDWEKSDLDESDWKPMKLPQHWEE